MNNIFTDPSQKMSRIFQSPVTAWVVLIVSVTITFTAFRISKKYAIGRAQDKFEIRAQEIQYAIRDRLNIYEELLWAGVAMLYTNDQMDRERFAKFVETLEINKKWIGIQGYGFSVPVEADEKKKFIDDIRAEGFLDFTIKPEGVRNFYSSIIYLEPFDWRNQRAFGYDMWSNAMRRAAMKKARDEGVAVTSGIITLVQETDDDVQRGFLTYVPAYKTRYIPKTVEERRRHFMGWVYAPYRAGNLMKGILGTDDEHIDFEIYDGEGMAVENLLFDSNGRVHIDDPEHNPDFSQITQVINQNRVWTIYFSTPANYLKMHYEKTPIYVAIAGIIVDFLLFYVLYSLYFIQRRVNRLAKEMSRDVSESKIKIQAELKRTEEKATQLVKTNRILVDREIRMSELKEENKMLRKNSSL